MQQEAIYKNRALCGDFTRTLNVPADCGRDILRNKYRNDQERLLRALTWHGRAEGAESDDDKVIFGYIALNALFGSWDDDQEIRRGKTQDDEETQARKPQDQLRLFVKKVVRNDDKGALLAVVRKQGAAITGIIENRFLWSLFWNADEHGKDWEPVQQQTLRKVDNCIQHVKDWKRKSKKNPVKETPPRIRGDVADVLYWAIYSVRVLRNQVMHGSCCYGDGYNRTQMRDCAEFLLPLVGRMIKIMIEAKGTGNSKWGRVATPPQGAPDDAQNKIAKPLESNGGE